MIVRRAAVALSLALACHPHRTRPAGVVAASFQIIAIDDGVDPFASARAPADVTIEDEIEPVGPGRDVPSHYARTVVRAGETDAAARVRLRAWLATVPLPAGARFGVGVVHDGPGSGHARSYVLAGPTVITTADVEDAVVAKQSAEPAITVTLFPGGAQRFEDFTRTWLQRRAAILLDDDVRSAPRIMTPIGGGRLQISLAGEDAASAERLAASLRPTR